MIRRPPRSTRTYTLFPYPTLFRSLVARQLGAGLQREVFAAHDAGVGRRGDNDLRRFRPCVIGRDKAAAAGEAVGRLGCTVPAVDGDPAAGIVLRSEEHTSELQSLMRTSYAVFCLKKKK